MAQHLPTGEALGSGQLYMDDRVGENPERALDLRGVAILVRLYALLTPWLLGAAALAYLYHLVMLAGGAKADLLWWTVQALWLMVLTRCVILVLVDISSFPAVNVDYLKPVFPLMTAAALLTLALPFRKTSSEPDPAGAAYRTHAQTKTPPDFSGGAVS
jgi:hypothetical protein